MYRRNTLSSKAQFGQWPLYRMFRDTWRLTFLAEYRNNNCNYISYFTYNAVSIKFFANSSSKLEEKNNFRYAQYTRRK